jgi:hypothetical protein
MRDDEVEPVATSFGSAIHVFADDAFAVGAITM